MRDVFAYKLVDYNKYRVKSEVPADGCETRCPDGWLSIKLSPSAPSASFGKRKEAVIKLHNCQNVTIPSGGSHISGSTNQRNIFLYFSR